MSEYEGDVAPDHTAALAARLVALVGQGSVRNDLMLRAIAEVDSGRQLDLMRWLVLCLLNTFDSAVRSGSSEEQALRRAHLESVATDLEFHDLISTLDDLNESHN